MKSVTKLLFVALLIGVALSLPSRVRASGTEGYTCEWSQYGQCYGQLQSWMDTCAQDCTSDEGYGGAQQFCYSIPTPTYVPFVVGGGTVYVLVTLYSTTCYQIPSNGASCIQNCVNEYNQQYNSCINNYCTAN